MVGIADEILSGIGDTVNGLLGDIGLFDKAKSLVDKAKPLAQQYAAATPQGQAVMAAQSAMKKQKSGKAQASALSPSVIPPPGSSVGKGGGVTSKFTSLKSKKMFGIPILFVAGGSIAALMLLKKKKR